MELSKQTQSGLAVPFVDEKVTLLDPRSASGVTVHDSSTGMRMWGATVSAGDSFERDGKTIPRVSREGKIILHEDMGDAPGIRAALQATGHKSLTITMLSDSIAGCMHQLFCCYDTVKVFGTAELLTIMEFSNNVQTRTEVRPGDPLWASTLALCKVSTFVPFALAEWKEDDTTQMTCPDGLIPYRLRWTSGNSTRALVDTLTSIRRLTNGKLIGVPLELKIVYKEVMTPKTGKRQKVPVWSMVLKHPKGILMSTSQIARVLSAGIQDAQQLALPATISALPEEIFQHDDRIEEELVREIDEADLSGSAADLKVATSEADQVATRIADFFRAVQGTPWASDEFRPVLIDRCAERAGVVLEDSSLRELARVASAEEWTIATTVFCRAAAEHLGTEGKAAKTAVEDEEPYAAPKETKVQEAPAAGTGVANSTGSGQEAAEKEIEPNLPEVASYLTLGRKLKEEELKAAQLFARQYLNHAQVKELTTVAGGIGFYELMLQAKKEGAITYGAIRRVVEPEFKDEPTDAPEGQEKLI